LAAVSTERTRAASAAGLPLVVLASALWGLDALFRRGLALSLPAPTVVLYEHLILVVLLLPVLVRVPWGSLRRADWVSLVVIGAGASAVATGLFTAAFRYGDPNAPLLLQKIQPFVAVLAARALLGERVEGRFGAYFALAVTGAWLITFPEPLEVTVQHAVPGLLAAGAATLWGLGTVLGRRMSSRLGFWDLTSARFAFGLPAAALIVALSPAEHRQVAIAAGDLAPLLLLALLPGLAALLLYYRGLARTPASVATLGELAFPLSALLVNYVAFGAVLTLTQLLGVVVLAATLLAMSAKGRGRAEDVGVLASEEPRSLAPARPV
jgi:drug/metabolite transporter, DME family